MGPRVGNEPLSLRRARIPPLWPTMDSQKSMPSQPFHRRSLLIQMGLAMPTLEDSWRHFPKASQLSNAARQVPIQLASLFNTVELNFRPSLTTHFEKFLAICSRSTW